MFNLAIPTQISLKSLVVVNVNIVTYMYMFPHLIMMVLSFIVSYNTKFCLDCLPSVDEIWIVEPQLVIVIVVFNL